MTIEHKVLTGNQLHEPKGISAASAGELGFASSNAISWGNVIGTITPQTASASSALEFTGLGDYQQLRITIVDLLRATSGTTLRMQFSDDNGSTWNATSVYNNGWADNAADDGEETTSANLTGDEDTSYVYTSGVLNIYSFNSPFYTYWDGQIIKSTAAGGTGSDSGAMIFGGYEALADWDALRIYSSSGNLTSGSVYIEGFRGT